MRYYIKCQEQNFNVTSTSGGGQEWKIRSVGRNNMPNRAGFTGKQRPVRLLHKAITPGKIYQLLFPYPTISFMFFTTMQTSLAVANMFLNLPPFIQKWMVDIWKIGKGNEDYFADYKYDERLQYLIIKHAIPLIPALHLTLLSVAGCSLQFFVFGYTYQILC